MTALRLSCAGLALALLPACAAPPPPPAPVDRLAWWREARLGVIVSYGLYTVPGGEWQGRTDLGSWFREGTHMPASQYEAYAAAWQPERFRPGRWAELCKAAGAGYLIFTAKHHDGFCLFDSAQTDFDVTGTPYHRDMVGEVAAACREHDLHFGVYYSILDWHHPDYLPRPAWETQTSPATAQYPRYVEYLQHQVAELLNHYGPIDVIWFDGDWDSTWTRSEGQALLDLCRTLQPQMLVNNRVGKGRAGLTGMTRGEVFLGDFATPEQQPPTQLPGVDWEMAMPLNQHWSWNRADDQWKSSTELIRTLAEVSSLGGNLLLGIGPMPNGELPPPVQDRLEQLADWMQHNGEAIHGTAASPFGQPAFGRCTFRPTPQGGRLYLHVFDWPVNGELRLPGVGNEVLAAATLEASPRSLPFRQHDGELLLQLPQLPLSEHDSVLTVDLLGAPRFYSPPKITAAAPFFVARLPVEIEAPPPGMSVHYTLDGSEPTRNARRYEAPIWLKDTTTVKARTFDGEVPVASVTVATFTRVPPRPAALQKQFLPGLECRIYPGNFTDLPDFSKLPQPPPSLRADVSLPAGPSPELQARTFDGFLQVPEDDVYTLALQSDDGARLWLDGELLVDNDGLHSGREVRGQAALAKGPHKLRVAWFNGAGSGELQLRWSRPGTPMQPVPATALVH